MKINLSGMIKEVFEGVKLLKENLNFEIADDGADIKVERCDKGFFVSVDNNCAEIKYERLTDFFRAFAIAVNALKKGKKIEINQNYTFDSCGIMVDVSRRAVLEVDSVKRIMRYMACMGLNRIMLYTEDTYEMDGHPYFGYMRGRYTKAELKEIVSYGNMLGVETVPCIQTLAHLYNPLKWNVYSDVRDTGDVLLAEEDKTYALIEDMIKTMRECYTTSSIHIGMDEAFGVGMGRYLQIHGLQDKLGILCKHLTKVTEISNKYGFEPMMWSDMIFHLMKKNEEGELPEDIEKMFPEGITLVHWDYYSRSEKHYENRVLEHKKLNRPVVFAGGIWTWSGPSVNYTQTFESTIPALKACKKYGVKDVFATMWGDDGAECDVLEGLYGMQLYAETNYNDSFSKKELDEMFKICTGCEAESFLLLDTENYYNKECSPEITVFEDERGIDGILTFSKQVLYQHPMFGLFDKNFESVDLKTHYTALCEKIKNVSVPAGFEEIFECRKIQLKILAAKCNIGMSLYNAYQEKDRDKLIKLSGVLKEISVDAEKLYDLRSKLWHKNNKAFGFEGIGNRILSVSAMAKTAYSRIDSFVNGDVDGLEELEAERLYYNSIEKPFVWEFTSFRIMTP